MFSPLHTVLHNRSRQGGRPEPLRLPTAEAGQAGGGTPGRYGPFYHVLSATVNKNPFPRCLRKRTLKMRKPLSGGIGVRSAITARPGFPAGMESAKISLDGAGHSWYNAAIFQMKMRGRGKGTPTSRFREPPGGARRYGGEARHWPQSSRAERRSAFRCGRHLPVIMQRQFVPPLRDGLIVMSGRGIRPAMRVVPRVRQGVCSRLSKT